MKNESEKAAHPQGFRQSRVSQSWSKVGAGRKEYGMRSDDEIGSHGDLEALTLCIDGLSKLFCESISAFQALCIVGQSAGSRQGYTTGYAK